MPKFIIKPDATKQYTIRFQSNGYVVVHGRSPYPNAETGTWFYFDDTQEKFIDSGLSYRNDGDYLEKTDIATVDALIEYLGIPK